MVWVGGRVIVPQSEWPDEVPPDGLYGWYGTVLCVTRRGTRVEIELDEGGTYYWPVRTVMRWLMSPEYAEARLALRDLSPNVPPPPVPDNNPVPAPRGPRPRLRDMAATLEVMRYDFGLAHDFF
jgi:hypothetical protein